MANHTTFRVGGPADLFVTPATEASFAALAEFCFEREVPVSLIGGGSNLLVSDRGIRGVVISLESLSSIEARTGEDAGSDSESGFEKAHPGALRATESDREPFIVTAGANPGAVPTERDPIIVTAGAGASMKALTEWCALRGIAGLERFAGLPGSVGGAAFMNARCYDLSVSDVFFEARALYFAEHGYTILTVPYAASEWDYKKSPLQAKAGRDPIALVPGDRAVTAVSFALASGDREEIGREMALYVADREAKGHFRYPSAGSMFKNNRAFGKPSGVIIDETGLKGFRIGDAQVASWHGNIVINAGNAAASDLRRLVETVRDRVFERTGFTLESEVIMAGDW